MKRTLLVYVLIIAAFVLYLFRYDAEGKERGVWEDQGLHGEIGETYVMITFQSGMEYWKSILKGYEDAADALGVSIEYRGATRYDAQEQRLVLEQAIAKKPAGIAISAIDPYSLLPTINKAVEAGIPVVLFDSDSPGSKAYSFLGTDNYNAGVTAADKMAQLLGREGSVGIITLNGQQNHEERTQGFKDIIMDRYPGMKVISTMDGRGDPVAVREAALRMLRDYPDLAGIFVTDAAGGAGAGEAVISAQRAGSVKIVSFDANKATLDMIRDGTLSASIAQGTWNMGYWSLQYLFHLHHGLTVPGPSPSGQNTPLPVRVDTGISVITKANVADYYAK
ncbi:substrate-binding domain-containing protein [Paenibacillus sp. P96]|uniref:Substrate-binding domain-containing protein n=1 Tax=Paenibacillus zeirhizosphaerae TaxID=2987519 RepID=A0ABT9FWC3_9BACL|nr:substrate-binding domain-containing protein [Paenibacillus sp. P96]MDP4099022.1 substrate-binding domain-containing protein [Paenibacillus sp. P96]